MTDPEKTESNQKLPWLRLTSDPYKIPDDLASALAGVVIEWGKFEMSLVADTSAMMMYPNIRNLATDAPRSFKKKIELWKRCIDALYPTIKLYRGWATEICSKGKIIARHRNRLIHGLWDISESKKPGLFRVVTFKGLDRIQDHEDKAIDAAYVAAVRNDIGAVSDALQSLLVNRMWHASKGLLQGVAVQKP